MRNPATGLAILLILELLSLVTPIPALGQEFHSSANSDSSPETSKENLKTMADLIRQLQVQLQGLHSEIGQLREEERNARIEIMALREDLNVAKTRTTSAEGRTSQQATTDAMYSSPAQAKEESTSAPVAIAENQSGDTGGRTVARMAEGLDLANQKINEQSQTKVESGSKYRLRLSGIVLFNLFSNRGAVDNQDFAGIAMTRQPLDSGATFGGSLRQSQIALQSFGPDIAGARTSADLRFDFAGGFSDTSNGTTMGIVRLRTATIRFDWSNTSIIGGQDRIFFAPLSPTSLASLAVPALAYSGNLWAWTPQLSVEHRIAFSDRSHLLLQGGIIESVSGEDTDSTFDRLATHGEHSGQPGYAARVAWSGREFGQQLTAGVGGYYARQNLGFGRTINSWIGSADVTLPLGKTLEFSGEFYRGKAVGGFGGAIGQSVFWNGQLGNPDTSVHALDSMGGWVQLKFKLRPKFEVNAAVGDDNPFSAELRPFKFNPTYSGALLSKNLSPFINFIYQPRSDVVFSTEYRYLKTFALDSNPNSANLINFAVGYIF